jgi:hypothetical protein
MPDPLSSEERALLDFELAHGDHPAKASAIRAVFDCAPARYYQRLSRLIDSERAEAAEPMLVHRLRRMRDAAARARASRTFVV